MEEVWVPLRTGGWLGSQVFLQVSPGEAERLWLGKHQFTDKNIQKNPRGRSSRSENLNRRSGEELRENWGGSAVGLDEGYMGWLAAGGATEGRHPHIHTGPWH